MVFFIISLTLAIASIIENRLLFNALFISIATYFSFNFCYGYDWMNYMEVYNNSLSDGYQPFFFTEPGLFWIMKFFSLLGFSFLQFLTVSFIFIYSSIYYFCNSLKSPTFAFFAIFSFFSIYILSEWFRQCLAICIVMIGLVFEKRGKGKAFPFLCILASFFHLFAIMLLPYHIITKKTGENTSKFIVVATMVATVIIYSIYYPTTLSFLPFIGEKIAQYGTILVDKQMGIFEFIMSSKIIFVYALMFFTLFILKRKYADLSLSLCAIYMLFISRFSSVLIRVGFYFVPFLVINMDGFISGKGRGMRIQLTKLICIFLISLISTSYLFNPVFNEGASYNLNIFSTKGDIDFVIGKKCSIINKYYEVHTFNLQCR